MYSILEGVKWYGKKNWSRVRGIGSAGDKVFKEVRIGLIDRMVIKKRLVGCEVSAV